MAHWIGVPVIVIPAVREWVIKTTGFLGGRFIDLYHYILAAALIESELP